MVIHLFGGNDRFVFAAETEANIVAEGFVKTDLASGTTIAEKNVKVTYNLGAIEADQIRYNQKSGLVEASGNVKLTSQTGIVLRAERLVYDLNTGEAQVTGGVGVKSPDGLSMTARQVNYNNKSGLAKAFGEVKVNNGNETLETETLDYDLKNGTGSSGAVSMILHTQSRDALVHADSMTLDGALYHFKNLKVTRCDRTHPEYQFVAKEGVYDGRYMELKSIFIYIKGVPVFYLPFKTLDMTNLWFPDIQLGYSHDDGLAVGYRYSAPINQNLDWRFGLLYRTNDYSTLKLGLNAKKDNISNYAGVYFDTPYSGVTDSEGAGIQDTITYNQPLFVTNIDGSKSFSANDDASELGFSITRKYWKSPLGRWQLGVLSRKVSNDDDGTEYGGTYGGYRLDYNPHPYLTLSLLRLYTLEGGDNWGDYMDDFKIGSNLMYSGEIPLRKFYSLGYSGTYSSTESLWIHQIYQINYRTDCLSLALGWDEAEHATVTKFMIRF
jgi:lipopolysaccharide export system protein LptA